MSELSPCGVNVNTKQVLGRSQGPTGKRLSSMGRDTGSVPYQIGLDTGHVPVSTGLPRLQATAPP